MSIDTSQEQEQSSGPRPQIEKIVEELRSQRPQMQRAPVSEQTLQSVRDVEQAILAARSATTLSSATTDEMERLALLDKHTELYNCKTFMKELKDEIKRCRRYLRPVSVCIVSIDGFKDLVKQNGTLAGDAILRILANVIRTSIRDEDIAARYSPDKFAIIFPEMSPARAALLAEKIRGRIGTQAISHNWRNLKVSGSIGVASFPTNALDYDELIARALQALDVAVQRGGDRVCAV